MIDRVVTLRVTRVFSKVVGSSVSVGDELPVLEGSWDSDKVGVAVNGVGWSPDGSEGVWFLRKMDGEALYRQLTSYGRLLYDAPADLVGPSGEEPDADGPWRNVRHGDIRTMGDAARFVGSLSGSRR